MRELIGRFKRIRNPKSGRIHFVGKLNGFDVELRPSANTMHGTDPDQFELWQDVQPRSGGATIHETQRHLLQGGTTLVVPARAFWRRDAPAVEPYFPEIGLTTTPRKRGRKGGKS